MNDIIMYIICIQTSPRNRYPKGENVLEFRGLLVLYEEKKIHVPKTI